MFTSGIESVLSVGIHYRAIFSMQLQGVSLLQLYSFGKGFCGHIL